MKIVHLTAHEIYDSRGVPTIECELFLEDGFVATACVPAGISKSKYEAVELRDHQQRLAGMGVLKVVENIEKVIAPALIGKVPNVITMDAVMTELDGTDNKSNLGANALLAVSMAVCRAQAYCEEMELYEFIAYICEYDSVALPSPMLNLINGGMHAGNSLAVQEFMVIPINMVSFSNAMEAGVTTFYALKDILAQQNRSHAVGDEGGFAVGFENEKEALDLLTQAIQQVESNFGYSLMMALDVAASHIYNAQSHTYLLHGMPMTTKEMIGWYQDLVSMYPIYSLEDAFDQDDWSAWHELYTLLGVKIQLVGDDIFASHAERIWEGISQKIVNTVLIKPNQIGTITETLQAIKLAQENGLKVVISHRSGDTADSFIADLAVGVSADQIKSGGCTRSENLAKYNRLLTIERQLLFQSQ